MDLNDQVGLVEGGRPASGISTEESDWVLEHLAVYIRLIDSVETEEKKPAEAIEEVGWQAPHPP